MLIQPEKRSKNKTDRRDANALGELLCTNRQRLLAGKKVQNVRRVVPPTQRDAENRELTALRQRVGRLRTRTSNQVQHLLLKHNLQLHVLRRDTVMKEWYRRIKRRRGAKIARVAVMRRLATILWHMLKHQQRYRLNNQLAEGSQHGSMPPDRNAFIEAIQGRSRGGKQKSCRGLAPEAAARP